MRRPPGSCGPFCWRTALALLLLSVLASCESADGYIEELLIHGLGDGAAMAHFESTAWTPLHTRHAGSFPPALLSLAQRYGVEQLELSLTQGRWAWEQQAAAVAAAAGPKPPGLELKVLFSPAVQDTRAAYGALTYALGGMLCASVATAPQLAVMAAPAVGWFSHEAPAVAAAAGAGVGSGLSQQQQKQQQQQQQQQPQQRQVYAWLPQEAPCIENLAAWRRLLPCREHAGLAALLQPVRLAAAPYYSLGLQLRVMAAPPAAAAGSTSGRNRNDSSSGGLQLKLRQTVTVVQPLPPGVAAAAEQPQGQPQGLLDAVFGVGLPPACAAASASMIYAAQPSPAAAAAAAAAGSGDGSACSLQQAPGGPLLACNASQALPHLPAGMLQQPGARSGGQKPASLQVVQHAVQRSSQAGALMLGIRVPASAVQPTGASSGGSALLHVMQLLPWQLLVDVPSLQLELDGQALQAGSTQLAWQSLDARPDRTAALELLVRLPPRVSSGGGSNTSSSSSDSSDGEGWHELVVRLGYRTAFVGVFEHAPDASRGVDIPPAVATLLPHACAHASTADLHSAARTSSGGAPATAAARQPPPLLGRLMAAGGCAVLQAYGGSVGGGPGGGSLVALPIPDFSMPFNVICFTSTLLAVLLGGVANVTLRSPEELAGSPSAAGSAPVWKRKARRLVALLVLMGGLALYLDRDLQRQADALLHRWVLGRVQAPEQHGEVH